MSLFLTCSLLGHVKHSCIVNNHLENVQQYLIYGQTVISFSETQGNGVHNNTMSTTNVWEILTELCVNDSSDSRYIDDKECNTVELHVFCIHGYQSRHHPT